MREFLKITDPEAQSLRGIVFEKFAHRMLPKGGSFTMRSLETLPSAPFVPDSVDVEDEVDDVEGDVEAEENDDTTMDIEEMDESSGELQHIIEESQPTSFNRIEDLVKVSS